MASIKMNLEEETKVTGEYQHLETWYGYPYSEIQRLNQPILVKDNLKRYYAGQDYEWVPDTVADQIDFTPTCNPDIVACGFEGGIDAFGVKWIPDVSAPDLPAFVEPGLIVLSDIEDWRSLTFPDVDSWRWKEQGAEYRAFYANDDRLKRGVVLSTFFERLIALMGFEGAAMAMLTNPDDVREFFTELVAVNNKIIDHFVDDFGCDAVMFHDDWSTQLNPFFSPQIVEDLLVPAVRACVDHAHERGILFTLHTCGNCTKLLPAIRATGADSCQLQLTALDAKNVIETLGGDVLVEFAAFELTGEKDIDDKLINQAWELPKAFRCLPQVYDYTENAFATRVNNYRIGRELAVTGVAQ